jgi:16S rRNA (guanine527-N7)-methyltransferase
LFERAQLVTLLEPSGLAGSVIERLAEYGTMLLDTNRRFNVTGADTPEELVGHLLDSLSIAQWVRAPLVDIGSGGGLPAIPLAIVTGAPVTMVESTTKKAAFLEAVLNTLHLDGAVIPQRAELAARDEALREQFTSGTARAVSSAPTVLELLLPFIALGGIAILQRGRMDEQERNAVMDAAPMLGARLEDEVPLDGERRVLLFEKVEPTPQRFPRRIGVPEKRPLCM